jgi:hypothetical protein
MFWRTSPNPPDVADSQGFQAFCAAKSQTIPAIAQALVNHFSQGLVNHAGKSAAGETGLTRLFKLKPKRSG